MHRKTERFVAPFLCFLEIKDTSENISPLRYGYHFNLRRKHRSNNFITYNFYLVQHSREILSRPEEGTAVVVLLIAILTPL